MSTFIQPLNRSIACLDKGYPHFAFLDFTLASLVANRLGGVEGACETAAGAAIACREAGDVMWLTDVAYKLDETVYADLVISVAPGSSYEPSTECTQCAWTWAWT